MNTLIIRKYHTFIARVRKRMKTGGLPQKEAVFLLFAIVFFVFSLFSLSRRPKIAELIELNRPSQ